MFNDQAHRHTPNTTPGIRATRSCSPSDLPHQHTSGTSDQPNSRVHRTRTSHSAVCKRTTPRPRAPPTQPTNNRSNTTDRRLWRSHRSIAPDHNFLSHSPLQAPYCAPRAPPRAPTTTRTDHRASATWTTFVAVLKLRAAHSCRVRLPSEPPDRPKQPTAPALRVVA